MEQRPHTELLLCQAQCDRSDDVEGERAEVAEIDTEVVAAKKPSTGSVSQTETDRVPASSCKQALNSATQQQTIFYKSTKSDRPTESAQPTTES